MKATHLILYTADQAASAAFYAKVLGLAPRLDVPGMTEFALPGGAVLGLMPIAGIRRLLGAALPDPA
ncbi:MAG: VOC family protein, partial [Anaerolineales bacterium]|nr:VOC family protein [Anaerolineales bacterium]